MQISLEMLIDLFADLHSQIDNLRAVLSPYVCSEGVLDPENPIYTPWKAAKKFVYLYLLEAHHVPDSMSKIVRAPAEFVCIIECISYQLPC